MLHQATSALMLCPPPSLPMPQKRDVLTHLTRDELVAIAVDDRRVKDKLVEAVVRELVGTSTAVPKAEEATGEAPQGQEAMEGPPERSKGTRRRGAGRQEASPETQTGTSAPRTRERAGRE